MKIYRVKNYKGNLVESLKKFSESHKGMKIVEAIEDDEELKIKVEEAEKVDVIEISDSDRKEYEKVLNRCPVDHAAMELHKSSLADKKWFVSCPCAMLYDAHKKIPIEVTYADSPEEVVVKWNKFTEEK